MRKDFLTVLDKNRGVMRSFSLKTFLFLFVLGTASTVMGDYMLPPMRPDWWTIDPDGQTRLQYRSFITDPDMNLEPDYVFDGYTSSTADDWTCPDSFNHVLTPPQLTDWGDGKALLVGADDSLSVLMGNVSNGVGEKEYFVEMVFRALDNQYGSIGDYPFLDITAPGSIYEHDMFSGGDGKNGWWRVSWHGLITPQPGQETFLFDFIEDTYVDSLWVGTHIPEPATIFMLGLGGLALRKKRRA